jgi:hypothetical protein
VIGSGVMPSPPGSLTMIWSFDAVPVTVSVEALTPAVVAHAAGASPSVTDRTAAKKTGVRLNSSAPTAPSRDRTRGILPYFQRE